MSNTQYHVPAVSQLYPRSDTLTQFQPSLSTANPSWFQPRFDTLNPNQSEFNTLHYPVPVRTQFQPIFGTSNPTQFQSSLNTVQYPPLPARTQFQSSIVSSSPYFTTPSSIFG